MDSDRRLRFLIAPFVLLSSLVWAGIVDPCESFARWLEESQGWNQVLGLIAAGGALLPLGFLIGVLSRTVLRLVDADFEVDVSPLALTRIQEVLRVKAPSSDAEQMNAVVVFDHWLLKRDMPGVHEWCVRRWTNYLVSVYCCVAIVLSGVLWVALRWYLAQPIFPDAIVKCWLLPCVLTVALLLWVARVAKRENRMMIEYVLTAGLPGSVGGGTSVR